MTTALDAAPAPSAVVRTGPRLLRVGYEPGGPGPAPAPARPARPPAVPSPVPTQPGAREAVTHTLRIACEVLDGRRPHSHLACHVDASVLRYWRAAANRRRVRSRARFSRVRISHPHPEAAEVAVAVEIDGRVRALAARFDRTDRHWRWTAVRLG